MLYLVMNYATCRRISSNLSGNESPFISNSMNFRECEQLILHWKLVFLNAFVLKQKKKNNWEKKCIFLGKQVFYLGHNLGYTC